MWDLEFRSSRDGTWEMWAQGSLEDCLRDALLLRAGGNGWDRLYDAARLSCER